MQDLDRIKGFIDRHRHQIQNDYHARVIGILGSYATGEVNEDSDLDVLVRFDDHASLFDLVGLGDFLEEHLNIKVDVVSDRSLHARIRPYVENRLIPV